MELKCFRTLWGVTTPWPQTLDELQRVGCCGIEARVPLTAEERRQLADRLQASGLEYIAILFSGGGVLPAQHETPEQHLARLQTRFAEASGLNPRFVNLLAGNDRWPLAQQVDFLGKAHELAAGFGLTCSFETHRATSLYSPWLTLEIVQQLPQLRKFIWSSFSRSSPSSGSAFWVFKSIQTKVISASATTSPLGLRVTTWLSVPLLPLSCSSLLLTVSTSPRTAGRR